MTTEVSTPNTETSAVPAESAVPSLESIAAKMTAMRDLTQRNQLRATEQPATGPDAEAKTASSPVAPDGMPEVAEPETEYAESTESDLALEESDQDQPVSENTDTDTASDELIDFIEFAETNPNAKFKFLKNGKEVIIDAKKAASILGQGGAIHEEARQLKIQRAEFDEYLQEQKTRQDGLTLAMEFTVQPQLQAAYDEIIKVQGYQTQFQEQLSRIQDPAQRARIQANMQQNERYLAQQGQVVNQLKPALETFYDLRRQQVSETLERQRRGFTDKELKNEYIYNELRDKLSKTWAGAQNEILPGIKNIDLLSSDENLLGLLRDGLKYRDKPATRQAGASIAALTGRKGGTASARGTEDSIVKLREQAKGGDKKAADNLLVAQLSRLRAARTGR
jgi:hypothetical protein